MSRIKHAFVSRFGPQGRLLELDFSQLEIYVLAFLSNDPVLKDDLVSGKDLHDISATMLFGSKFNKAQRKIAKQLSFQLQYGAGARSMAETNNIDIQAAKDFIDAYYDRYKGVKLYHKGLLEEVVLCREASDLRTKKGQPAGVSKVRSLTGRTYTFVEDDSPDWMSKSTGFSPTKTKNYPVQGFATGDIVPMVLGKIYRTLRSKPGYKENVLMINTIHDSLMFDVRSEYTAEWWAKECKRIMEDAPAQLKATFGIDFDLPLKAGIDIGYSWGDMVEYNCA